MSKTEHVPPAPWHMWVIGAALLINSGIGTIGYLATLFRYEPFLSGLTEDALAYYLNAPLWMYVMWGVSILGGLLCAILLLMRRRLSIPIGILAWAASVIAVIYTVVNPPPGGGNTLFAVVVILLVLLALHYMHQLKKRGVLR